MKKLILGIAACVVMSVANAGVIIDNTVSGSVVNNFDSLGTGNVAGFITQTGAAYGEHFSGQTLDVIGGFDGLTGTPSAPLNLVANPVVDDNIGALFGGFADDPLNSALAANSSNAIYGASKGKIGQGALSILLGAGSDVFGFNVIGSNGGPFTAQFFGSNGRLLGSLTQTLMGDAFFGFRTTAGDRIFGVSITNTDLHGIAYDDVTFNRFAAGVVPEPAPLALLGLGLAGVAVFVDASNARDESIAAIERRLRPPFLIPTYWNSWAPHLLQA